MEIPHDQWFSELETDEGQYFKTYDEMKILYDDTVDHNLISNVVDSSVSSENKKLIIDQTLQIDHHHHEIKHTNCYQETTTTNKANFNKRSRSTNHHPDQPVRNPSTFTISFGNDQTHKNEIIQLIPDLLGFEAASNYTSCCTKVNPTMATRNNTQAIDHVLSERKRREKLTQHFISLSSLLPNLKKMDKVSVLEDASNYIKQLEDRVKELEGLLSCNKRSKDVEECVISMKRIINSDDDESEETENDDVNACESISPEIQVRVSGSNLLVRIQCQKNDCSMVNTLTQMHKFGLSIISSSSMPFVNNNIILIIVVAEIKDDFCMTTKELVKNLQEVLI